MTPRALIIEARFYEDIAEMLLSGAKAELDRRGINIEVVSVPGVLEIPIALAMAIHASRRSDDAFDMFVGLGCVVRGETSHYDIVAGEGNRAIMDLVTANKAPFGNGILTVETKAQAVVRADPKQKDKGGDAAAAAVALYELRGALYQ